MTTYSIALDRASRRLVACVPERAGDAALVSAIAAGMGRVPGAQAAQVPESGAAAGQMEQMDVLRGLILSDHHPYTVPVDAPEYLATVEFTSGDLGQLLDEAGVQRQLALRPRTRAGVAPEQL